MFWNLKWIIFKEKIGSKRTFLTDTLAKIHNIFAYSYVSEHFRHFFFFILRKNFSGGRVDPPPPLADASAKNASFFYVLPFIF